MAPPLSALSALSDAAGAAGAAVSLGSAVAGNNPVAGPLADALSGAAGAAGPLGAAAGALSGAADAAALAGAAAAAAGPLPGLTNVTNGDGNNILASGEANDNGNDVISKNKVDFLKNIPILLTEHYMKIFMPADLHNDKNSKILLNVIMLYAINYIYKYEVSREHYNRLKEIRDYLEIYKNFLLERTLIMSKDYLDIVHDAVEDIKLGEERNFLNEQDNNKMNNENINANNNLTYNYIKLGVENSSFFSTITSGIANIWKVMMMWTKPFAGLVILILFIAFIILIFFGEDDTSPENSGGVGTGSLVGPSNFNFFSQNMQGGKTNNNTDIISVLQRLPQNIYSFFDKLSAAYTKFSNYVNSSRDFMNSLSDTTPIITNRREQEGNNSKGLYDNIYTFDYQYIDTINKSTGISTCSSSTIDAPNESISTKSNYVYNIKRPKKNSQSKISEYYDISHEYMFYKDGTNNDEYIYAPQCGSNNYVDDDCTIKTKDCGDERKEDTSVYKNIII